MQNDCHIKRPCLYVVGTPIGNLLDFTMRAKLILSDVDYILAEDTRKSRTLLDFYKIKTKMRAFNEWSEKKNALNIAEKIKKQNLAYAIISDAGMPQISDPGFLLVKSCIDMAIEVTTVPGPSALTASVSLSNLRFNKFVFEGFLPRHKERRLRELLRLRGETRGMVFFEAPHRIIALLKSIEQVFGLDRQMVVARELTKTFETCYRGSVSEILAKLQKNSNECKGEFTVILSGRDKFEYTSEELNRWLNILLQHMELKDARAVLKEFGVFRRNMIYEFTIKKG